MKALSILIAAGLATAASAQGNMTLTWTVSDTGDQDGIIETGESALLTLSAKMTPVFFMPPLIGFAGTTYDIIGGQNWATGTLVSYDNKLDALTGDGTLIGYNDIVDIESFQLPPDFNNVFYVDNPIVLYTITWTPDTYTPRTVEVTSMNHNGFFVYTSLGGSTASYFGVANGISFDVRP